MGRRAPSDVVRGVPGKPTWARKPPPPPAPGVQTPWAAGTEAGGRGDSGEANHSSTGPSRSPTPTPAPRPTSSPRMGAHSRKGAQEAGKTRRTARKGGGGGGCLGAGCSGWPSPAAPERLGKKSRSCRPALSRLLRSRRCAPGGTPRPDGRGFHHLLTVPHKPVTRALPGAGVAPKGVPEGGGFLLVGSGRPCPLPTTPLRGPVALSLGGQNPPL